jgi:mannitol-1-/sugar-/sorbitol-6-/2-deoxyglucose-6-phosphatase
MTWQPQAVIFDMDGLLVDSETVWHIAEAAMINARGHDYTADVRALVIGMRMDEFLTILHDHYQLEESVPELVDELNAAMLKLIPTHVKPQPGANEAIAYVQSRNWPVAIASSSPPGIIDAIVEAQGWGEVFKIRCSADHEAYGKPAPDVYLTTARVLGVDPADCLALEDSPAGAKAAVAAGMTCYAVPDSSHSPRSLFADITPHVFDSLHEVVETLRQQVNKESL